MGTLAGSQRVSLQMAPPKRQGGPKGEEHKEKSSGMIMERKGGREKKNFSDIMGKKTTTYW